MTEEVAIERLRDLHVITPEVKNQILNGTFNKRINENLPYLMISDKGEEQYVTGRQLLAFQQRRDFDFEFYRCNQKTQRRCFMECLTLIWKALDVPTEKKTKDYVTEDVLELKDGLTIMAKMLEGKRRVRIKDKYYDTSRWKLYRAVFLMERPEEERYVCEYTKKSAYRKCIILHHKNYDHIGFEILHRDELMFVSKSSHYEIHKKLREENIVLSAGAATEKKSIKTRRCVKASKPEEYVRAA